MLVRTLLMIIALGCAGDVAWSAESNSFVVRDVRVFDGHSTHDALNVFVENGLVRAISSDVPQPGHGPVIDGRGRTLLPGLINSSRSSTRFTHETARPSCM